MGDLFETISVFYSQDRVREARTHNIKGTWYVSMLVDGDLIDFRSMGKHNESYAESCAENFVMCIGEFNRNYDEAETLFRSNV